jgi:3-deoxy-alpha-D-manno-octulosonate 8-oxidase
MLPEFRVFTAVPKIIFAKDSLSEVGNVISDHFKNKSGYVVYFIDHFFKEGILLDKIKPKEKDFIFYVDTTDEPKTNNIDHYVQQIKGASSLLPDIIIGIGGGSSMDTAKAVSILLTNPGKAEDYQGWDLVKNLPLKKIGIPTISGAGAEVSRTAVLSSSIKKQGINSIHSMFDLIILDPTLLASVPKTQRFYTAMDCYIHSVEAISGEFLNEFSRSYAEKALDLCRSVFLGNGTDGDLMIASMLGGYSIVYSEVGVCHALSYGIAYAFGFHHGEANCIVFDYLDEYYPCYIGEFRKMLNKFSIELPRDLSRGLSPEMLEKMIDLTLLMERPLNNALGNDWKNIFTRDKIKELYLRM